MLKPAFLYLCHDCKRSWKNCPTGRCPACRSTHVYPANWSRVPLSFGKWCCQIRPPRPAFPARPTVRRPPLLSVDVTDANNVTVSILDKNRNVLGTYSQDVYLSFQGWSLPCT